MDNPKSVATMVIYICWDCGGDFEVSEHDGLTDDMEVTCPACGSDLVAVDFAAVRRRRPQRSRLPGPVDVSAIPHTGEAC
ncbi:MAG TPA: hypothetical protein VMH50_06225 [Thermoleophilia bacterium]|nr:hypothetical protein [Thermoleophilia bacterium]